MGRRRGVFTFLANIGAGADEAPVRSVSFHYLSLVKNEYGALIGRATQAFADRRIAFSATAHGYDVLANLDAVKGLLRQPQAIVEMPLHTAARLLQDREFATAFKAIGSPYTFTQSEAKVFLYHYGDNAKYTVKRLICTSRDSIATQLFRYYARRRGWPHLAEIDRNTLELPTYEDVLEAAKPQHHRRVENRKEEAFLISGVGRVNANGGVIAALENLVGLGKDGTRLGLWAIRDLYEKAHGWWAKSFPPVDGELPDLPGTILVARVDPQEAHDPFFRPLLESIALWSGSEENRGKLLKAGMGPPHLGTPMGALATVLYMEIMADELASVGSERLPTLGYQHFFLTTDAAHWSTGRREASRAVHIAGDHLHRARIEAMRHLDIEAYTGPADSESGPPAERLAAFDRKFLPALVRTREQLVAAVKEQSDNPTVRQRVEEAFAAVTLAKSEFRRIVLPVRRAVTPARSAFTEIAFPRGEHGIEKLRIRSDSFLSADPQVRKRVKPILAPKSEKSRIRVLILQMAGAICARGWISNSDLREQFPAAPKRFAARAHQMRSAFRFIKAWSSGQGLDLAMIRAIVHPDDRPPLEAAAMAAPQARAGGEPRPQP